MNNQNLYINYPHLVDNAMRGIVMKALSVVANNGVMGEHYFYISFLTNHPGVILSKRVREKYPEELTIVLQYQFEDLFVEENKFRVKLSFDSIKENVEVPIDALTSFIDASTKFSIQFNPDLANTDDYNVKSLSKTDEKKSKKKLTTNPTDKEKLEDKTEEACNIIDLDKFRNK